jgi:hypothetical protein
MGLEQSGFCREIAAGLGCDWWNEGIHTLTFYLQPKFIESIRNLPMNKIKTEGKRVAALPDSEIFTFEDVE